MTFYKMTTQQHKPGTLMSIFTGQEKEMKSQKYTKNLHMYFLDDGGEPLDPEAKELMEARLGEKCVGKLGTSPKHIGQWLKTKHLVPFARDFRLRADKDGLEIHPLSK